MKSIFRPRWLSIFTVAALAFGGIRLAADWLLPGAHQRLVRQYAAQITALPDEQAARFLGRLAEKDAEWADVMLLATADDRPLVAGAGERELRSLMLRLAQLPADQRAPHAAQMARALATTAPILPPDRRTLPASLANELIAWPIDSRTIDAAQFIADCEAVLILPLAEPVEVRLAAAPSTSSEPLPQEFLPSPSLPQPLPVELTPEPAPVLIAPEPTPPPAAVPQSPAPPSPAPPSPNEPQRFVPGRTIRISDDE